MVFEILGQLTALIDTLFDFCVGDISGNNYLTGKKKRLLDRVPTQFGSNLLHGPVKVDGHGTHDEEHEHDDHVDHVDWMRTVVAEHHCRRAPSRERAGHREQEQYGPEDEPPAGRRAGRGTAQGGRQADPSGRPTSEFGRVNVDPDPGTGVPPPSHDHS